MPSGHVQKANVCQTIRQHMKRDGHSSHFSTENYFPNSHVQHLKPSCHYISQIHGALNWKKQLHRSCSPVAVKQKHRCRVNPNTILWKKSTLKRGSESLVLLGRPCSLSSKSDITPGNSEMSRSILFFMKRTTSCSLWRALGMCVGVE